ncbi:BTB/POZ and MATH domain-containing protein 1 [Triticum urartu]|uniref:BTB/POZ and MATH domain-containing protein 1 n=2 Tax=Triticum urartu TaxID=4572 RepID=M7Z6N1_TRIUA|nr:BTB/POZ and MATH domain-containing protein 1 [Triticum urartu]
MQTWSSSFTEFKLDYPEIKNHGLINPLSKSISAEHYSWKIECYYWEDDEDVVLNLSLHLDSQFNRLNGFCEAFLRNRLESRYVKNGVITLICGVMALPGNSIPVPAMNIGDHLGSLLECPDGSDVSFVVGGETFRAHWAVLAARSLVFRVEIFGSLAEATMQCITLHEIEPSTLKAILRFMYTDRLSVDFDPESFSFSPTAQQLRHILAAADRYDIGRLKLMCAQKLWDMVSVETVTTTLGYADMYGCPELKNRCLDFCMAGKNFTRIVVTEGYLWLMQRFPSVIDEIKARPVEKIIYV